MHKEFFIAFAIVAGLYSFAFGWKAVMEASTQSHEEIVMKGD